jgi:probable phosphoglycerate mutase
MTSQTIVFVRHGETDWNIDGRLQGQTDIPLNENGRAQAQRQGKIILEHIPEAADFDFVSSPLIRARETMEIVRRTMGLDPLAYRTDDRLRELAYGDWEGFTLDELRVSAPTKTAEREADKWDFLPPSGESYAMLAARVEDWLKTVVEPTVVVAHGGVGRVLWAKWGKLDNALAITKHFPQDELMLWHDGVLSWV